MGVFSAVEYLPSLCNCGKKAKAFQIFVSKNRMIVIIRVLSKRKMSFDNSVHYCQGNAGILDLYSTLSVQLCEFVCVCVCVVVPNFHIIQQLFFSFLGRGGGLTNLKTFELFIHPSIAPSIDQHLHGNVFLMAVLVFSTGCFKSNKSI